MLALWNADRGFGFIGSNAGGRDVFLHISELKALDPDSLKVGGRLTFETASTRGGKTTNASNVRGA